MMRIAATPMSPRFGDTEAHHHLCNAVGRSWQILLQKCFVFSVNSDSVALMRFAMEAVDDGAAESRSRTIFLFIPA